MFQLYFILNRIHGSVGKALRTRNQGRVTANSHARLIRALDICMGAKAYITKHYLLVKTTYLSLQTPSSSNRRQFIQSTPPPTISNVGVFMSNEI